MSAHQSLLDIVAFWFSGDLAVLNKALWFSSGAQRDAADQRVLPFLPVLTRALHGEWCDKAALGVKECLGLIVLCDQMSRHLARCVEIDLGKCDALALEITSWMLDKGWDETLNAAELAFCLMPLRHKAAREDVDTLLDVIARVDRREGVEEERMAVLRRFRRASVRRLQDAQSLARGSAGEATDDSILERAYRVTSEEGLDKTAAFVAMDAFLDKHAKESKTLIVSLSGGVDSMVLAFLCVRLAKKHGIERVVGGHIDYGNRSESAAEADYVRRWCEKEGILYRVRRIDEVRRGHTARDEYEKESRRLRFAFYDTMMAEFGDAHGVMFGHHAGDVRENVLSNIMRGAGILELAGMDPVSVVNGVPIWRPALALEKEALFDVSHKYGIPYFKDTTPDWSTRGKMRRRLLPILHDMYGDAPERNLTQLALESEQLRALVEDNVLRPFFSTVSVSPAAVWFDLSPHGERTFMFWKEVIKTICHKLLGHGLVRDDAIQTVFMQRVQRDGLSPAWLHLRSTLHVYEEDKMVYFLRHEAFAGLTQENDDKLKITDAKQAAREEKRRKKLEKKEQRSRRKQRCDDDDEEPAFELTFELDLFDSENVKEEDENVGDASTDPSKERSAMKHAAAPSTQVFVDVDGPGIEIDGWTVTVSTTAADAPKTDPFTMVDVCKGDLTYHLPKTASYVLSTGKHVDRMRKLPLRLRDVLPAVVPQGAEQPGMVLVRVVVTERTPLLCTAASVLGL